MYLRLLLYSCTISSMLYAKKIEHTESAYCQRWNWKSICDFSYANHVDTGMKEFKNDTPFNPSDVKPGDVIFATGHSINDFFEKVNPHIKHPYILVTLFGGVLEKYLNEPKVIAWFANDAGTIQNHPKFTMIPIGLPRSVALFYKQKEWNKFFLNLRRKPKKKLLYMNFSRHHWSPERQEIYALFKQEPFVVIGQRKPFTGYMEEMANFKFTLSPQGDMWDCHRHWEAIMVGTIPIVIRSCISDLLKDLPVLIVDDWREITEEFLNKKYNEIRHKKYNLSKLYLHYWINKIDAAKQNIL